MQYLFALTLLFAPLYAVRFTLWGVPTNVLMLWVFCVLLAGVGWVVVTKRVRHCLQWLGTELRTIQSGLVLLFLLSGVASLFVGGVSEDKLGQLLVLFLQPIGMYFLVRYYAYATNLQLEVGSLLSKASLLFVCVCGVYAIIQYTTLLGVPEAWWGNAVEPKRALTFFLHPNFYALFVTPLLAYLLPQILKFQIPNNKSQANSKTQILNIRLALPSTLYPLLSWLLGVVGLFLSLSRGGWVGLAAAVVVFVLVAGNRKVLVAAGAAFLIMIAVVFTVPNFRYRVLLPFQGEKSSVARFSLWNTGWEMVKDSPVLGKGLLGFSTNWDAYNTDPNLQRYPAPHNIFLNFWVDTGLLGLVSFVGMLGLLIWRGLQKGVDTVGFKRGLALAFVTLLVHGLVDIPYLKNDLAIVFWLLVSII